MVAFLAKYGWLLPFLLLTLATQAQDDLERAQEHFPNEEVVLTRSYVHYDFKTPKGNQVPTVEESREEQYLSLKGGHAFTYAMFYDDNSFVRQFQAESDVHDEAYQTESIFHSDLRVKYTQVRTKQRGNAPKIAATKVYEDLKYLTTVYLTTPQSCLERTVRFTIPVEYDVELVPVNFDKFDVSVKEETKRNSRIIEYTVKNLKGYSDYGLMPGHSYIYPHIIIMPKQYKDDKQEHVYFNSLDALYAWYRELVVEIDDKPEELKGIVQELTEGVESEEQQIKNIFYWVQDNIRYIAFEDGIAGYQPENCQTVFYNRYGDCKGMANLTKHMLLLAGFDARLVWLGTKSSATNYRTPSIASANHMICAVKIGDEFIFLDGTEKHTLLGFYAERIQNQEVIIEDGDSYIHTKIPVQDHLQNSTLYTMDVTLLEDQTLHAQAKMLERGEAMSRILYLYTRTKNNEKKEALERYLRSYDKHTTVEAFEEPVIDRDAKELLLEGTLAIKNKVSSYDDELYINLDLYEIYDNYELQEDREHPLWLTYKTNDQVQITFKLPEGYALSSFPKAVSVDNPDFNIQASYEQKGDQLLYKVQVQVPTAEVSTDQLDAWNEAIKALRTFYEEPIVLVKS